MASEQLDEGRGNTFVLVRAERVAGNRSDLAAMSRVLTKVERLQAAATTQSPMFKEVLAISASILRLARVTIHDFGISILPGIQSESLQMRNFRDYGVRYKSNLRFHEPANEIRDLVRLRIERKVTGIKHLHFRIRHIIAIALRLARIKGQIVLSPND